MHPAYRADVAHRCICFRCPSARFRALWCCPRRASRRSRSRSPVRATSSRRTSILTRVRPAHMQYTASTRSLFWMACTLSSAGAGWLILPSLEALVVTTHATCFRAVCISLRSVMHIKEQGALRPKHALSHLKTYLKSVQKKTKKSPGSNGPVVVYLVQTRARHKSRRRNGLRANPSRRRTAR